MDELLIEDKKYVSSKRAAQVTGYAKDYIGQLCREGRVPARLVGRGWYVLETAIQDHRFGTTDIQPERSIETSLEPIISPTWESPRYESSEDELLPSINRLKEATDHVVPHTEESNSSESLQDTWKDWFDRIADAGGGDGEIKKEEETEEFKTKEPTEAVEIREIGKDTEDTSIEVKRTESKEVNVPVHSVYQEPPEGLLPRSIHVETRFSDEPREETPHQKKHWASRATMRAVQISGVLVATVAVVVAFVGTGYLDEYVISNSQGRIISGAVLYNK